LLWKSANLHLFLFINLSRLILIPYFALPVFCSTDLKNLIAAAVGLLTPLPEFVFIIANVSAVSFQLQRET
jgi:hypothetical protein